VVGDLVVEARDVDAVDGVHRDRVLHARYVKACAVAGDHDLVGDATEVDGALIAGDRPALFDAGDGQSGTGRRCGRCARRRRRCRGRRLRPAGGGCRATRGDGRVGQESGQPTMRRSVDAEDREPQRDCDCPNDEESGQDPPHPGARGGPRRRPWGRASVTRRRRRWKSGTGRGGPLPRRRADTGFGRTCAISQWLLELPDSRLGVIFRLHPQMLPHEDRRK
jgi:hypothetical protein